MYSSKQAVSAIFISLIRLAQLPVEAFSIGKIPTTNQLPDSPSLSRTISQEQQLCAALEKFHKKYDISKRSRYDLERTDHGQFGQVFHEDVKAADLSETDADTKILSIPRLNFCKLDSAAGLIRFHLRNIARPSPQPLFKDVFNQLKKGLTGYIINQFPQWVQILEVLQQI